MSEKETILVCPLNWGLGHATRCAPIIRKMLDEGHRVIIGAEQAPLAFLKQEFPDLEFVEFPGFRVRYFKNPFFFLGLMVQAPLFYFSFLQEKRQLNQMINQYGITRVISDNRYGVHHQSVYSVFITHQLFIQLPKHLKRLEKPLHHVTRCLINRFDECWVPDYEEEKISLSGQLSHGKLLPKNVRYIGPLSRFSTPVFSIETIEPNAYPDVLILISGPEPHRTGFEHEMEQRFSAIKNSVLMVCGKPDGGQEPIIQLQNGITKINHLDSSQLYFYLKNSKQIIARSGYSTIMDLHVLGRTAELIPTPGQTEQEYLSARIKTSASEKEQV